MDCRLAPSLMSFQLVPVAASFAAVVLLTPLIRNAVRVIGLLDKPRDDRWHKTPTARFGGVAIFVAVNVGCWAGGLWPLAWPILVASAAMFAIGLADDFLRFGPAQKLALQFVPALLVVNRGFILPWTSWEAVNVAFTLLWLVGITNAINLLD